MHFEWDATKAAANLKKHGVPFEEATTVFGDRFATTILDRNHSTSEERWLTTGLSSRGRIIVVWHANRGATSRIIGARSATASERRVYESGE